MNVMDACQWQNKSMLCYEDRLITYEHWPKQLRLNQFQLAKAGEYDKVTCFCCNLTLFVWEQTGKPSKEHERLSPSCLYIKMIGAEPTEDQTVETSPFGMGKDENKEVGFQPFNIGFGSNTFPACLRNPFRRNALIWRCHPFFRDCHLIQAVDMTHQRRAFIHDSSKRCLQS